MSVSIVYEDIALDIKEKLIFAADNITDYSNLQNIKLENVAFANFDNPCALYSVVLDSTLPNFPNNPKDYNWGLVSNEVSQLDGTFTNVPQITITSPESFSSSGVLLTFDVNKDQWANNLIIDWYRGHTMSGYTLIERQQFYPDNPVYFCANAVTAYSRLVITFISLNMPKNRLVFNGIDLGMTRVFSSEEIKNINCIQEVNPISSEIAINTADFTLNSLTDTDFIFQSRQGLKIYFDDELKMTCFVDKSNRLSKDIWKISAYDYIGLLDKATFYGGIFTNKNVGVLLKEILETENIPYTIEPDLAAKTISGYLAIMTKREALAQILISINAIANTANSETLDIYKTSENVVAAILDEDVFIGGNAESAEKIYEVQLHSHIYNPIDEIFEAYNTANSSIGQNITVRFTEPLHSLSIVNGNILQSNANYAIINANAGCILTGKRFNHVIKVYSKINPVWNEADIKKIVSVENVTINSDPAETLNNIFEYLSRNQILTSDVRIDGFKSGDTISIPTEFLGRLAGICESMRFSLNGGFIKGNITIRSKTISETIAAGMYFAGNELYSNEEVGII